MYEIIYSIDYAPNDNAVKISKLMSSLDLGIDRIFITGEFTIKTTTKPTKSYLEKLEDQMRLAISAAGGLAYNIELVKCSKIL